jgi:hypothetical protein
MAPDPQKSDRWLDAALVVCTGILGLLLGFFAMVIAAAQGGLASAWITVLAAAGGIAGGLSAWILYVGLLRRQSQITRMTVLVLVLALLALVLPLPFQYILIRG